MKKSIPTYIINLSKRLDRKEHILAQFYGRNEFTVHIVEATEHNNGACGLWENIRHILLNLVTDQSGYILLCEDDHEFTSSYSKRLLFKSIELAIQKNADILSGGVSWFRDAVKVTKELYWIGTFSGLQFTIIFKKFFPTILNANFSLGDAADFKISGLSTNKFLIYPFISIQKEFGYSDVTQKNNLEGRVSDLFNTSSKTISHLEKAGQFYKQKEKNSASMIDLPQLDNMTIPVYAINLIERADRLEHIKKQFLNKPEFDLSIVEACKHPIGAVGLWLGIRKIVEFAITNKDDVIIICEDDHEFTSCYTKEFLLRNIIEAHHEGADILSGGIGGFNHAIKISESRFWISHFYSTQFIVVYKKFFKKILEAEYDDKVTADDFISQLTSNKMVIYPFISVQKDFGYSDVTASNNIAGHIDYLFSQSQNRLTQIQQVHLTHQETNRRYLRETYRNNRVVIIVPFYNVKNYISECYNSIYQQKYDNYEVIFIDDLSTDGSVETLLSINDTIHITKNTKRQFQLKNFHEALTTESFDDEDIIALIDGDDYLLHENVLTFLNDLYNSKECFVCYGQYITTAGRLGHCYPYQKEEFSLLRKLDWRASHLKTFKYKVYKEFLNQDPHCTSYIDEQTGNYYAVSGDVAIMHPLMEIAGYERTYFNAEPLYVYRIYEGNDSSQHLKEQFEAAKRINEFAPFKQMF